ncbi:molybdenum cofactor biosynthesis protein MoaE [Marinobacter oulmenensis]|uniref:Molybdopterin synthase catalytic subunit n=1 Tax=Marinobacter oulmenensis TaxID=643747 RepID=A0A840UJB2_9GAMM|nr:molybdenum cofactor biosynthesis protein MoaE [Marinobacter oulmenensis]MBB5320887.1 molybdopterin synthase catalytic subunit [Marinobacter oulmenensis]
MISIQTADFAPDVEYQALRGEGEDTGAIVTFTGLVRDFGDRQGVTGLFLEHYPGMTEQAIQALIDQAHQRWQIQRTRVIHRVGNLDLGERIVFVGVASAHRKDAFAACEYLIDALKASVPLWKKERGTDGDHWVEQKASDRQPGF